MVVTASLEGEKADEVPASVTVISADEIKERQATTVSELVATVPGASVAQSGSPGHTTSMFTRGANSNQTLVLWNGVPLNDPILGAFDFAYLPAEGIDRIEVVRGPFSSLYGSNAIGGVVQVFSATTQGADVHLEGGDRGYGRGSVAAGQDVGPVHLDLIGHVQRDDGEFANDFYRTEEVVARAQWAVTPHSTLGALIRVNDSDVGIPFDGATASPFRKTAWQERELAIPFGWTGGPWKLDVLFSGVSTSLTFRDPQSSFSSSDADTRDYRGRAVASYALDPSSWVALGVEWQRQEGTSTDNFGVELEKKHERDEAEFAQLHYGLGIVRFDLGLREEENQLFGNHLSPNAGIQLLLSKAVHFHVAYGDGFRAPALGELFFPFSGNPALKPETTRGYEAGLELLAGGFAFDLTGFDNRQRNQIEFDFVTSQDLNIGRARSRGAETELRYRSKILAVRLNGTYLDAKDLDTGLALLRRPRKSSNLVVSFFPIPGWTFNLVGRNVGERADIDPVRFTRASNPGYTRIDLTARWQAWTRLAPYLRIDNVADRSYSEVLGFPAPKRRFRVGLNATF